LSARRPASVIRTRATSIDLPPATTRSADAVASPAAIPDAEIRILPSQPASPVSDSAMQRFESCLRIEEHGDAGMLGGYFLQNFNPFSAHRKFEGSKSGYVSARPRQIRHESLTDRIGDRDEYDRDGFGRIAECRQAFGRAGEDDIWL
jgi:hypothetical protein